MLRSELFLNLLRGELQKGQKKASDRVNSILPDLALRKTIATDSQWSDWWAGECLVCQYTFREGDLVRLCPTCNQAYHDDPSFNLECWHTHFADGSSCAQCHDFVWTGGVLEGKHPPQVHQGLFYKIEDQFHDGLVAHWKTYSNAKTRIVRPGDGIVGHSCPGCKYKIRAGDKVVKCPCSPECNVFWHNDQIRQMTCWNYWNGEKGKNYCPISSRHYEAGSAKKL